MSAMPRIIGERALAATTPRQSGRMSGDPEPACSAGNTAPKAAPHRRRAFSDDRFEDGLLVGRGARDHAQDLTGRRLLLQGFGEVSVLACSWLNSRTFSMAMAAWSAKVSIRVIWLSVNGRTSGGRGTITPTATRPEHRDTAARFAWGHTCRGRVLPPGGGRRPGYRECGRCARSRAARAIGASRRTGREVFDERILRSGEALWVATTRSTIAVKAEDECALRLAQPACVLGQRLEDRLQIEGGPPDHLEELAGRRLLLERDPQLAVARLQLVTADFSLPFQVQIHPSSFSR